MHDLIYLKPPALIIYFLRDTPPDPDLTSAVIFILIFTFIASFILYKVLKFFNLIQTPEGFKANFRRYKTEYREKKLINYANTKTKRKTVSEILCMYFTEITPKVRDEALEKISGDEKAPVFRNTAKTLTKNFELIPKNLREKILLKFSENKSEEAKKLISEILLMEFNEIPEDLRLKLISTASQGSLKETKENLIQVVYVNFTNIPDELREKIILNAINSPEIEETYIKAAIKRHEKSLPKNLIEYASKKLNF